MIKSLINSERFSFFQLSQSFAVMKRKFLDLVMSSSFCEQIKRSLAACIRYDWSLYQNMLTLVNESSGTVF
jgi:hypothetical protein